MRRCTTGLPGRGGKTACPFAAARSFVLGDTVVVQRAGDVLLHRICALVLERAAQEREPYDFQRHARCYLGPRSCARLAERIRKVAARAARASLRVAYAADGAAWKHFVSRGFRRGRAAGRGAHRGCSSRGWIKEPADIFALEGRSARSRVRRMRRVLANSSCRNLFGSIRGTRRLRSTASSTRLVLRQSATPRRRHSRIAALDLGGVPLRAASFRRSSMQRVTTRCASTGSADTVVDQPRRDSSARSTVDGMLERLMTQCRPVAGTPSYGQFAGGRQDRGVHRLARADDAR